MNTAENYWIRAHIGDVVFDVADERHLGRIERIDWHKTARVRWIETGWISELPMTALRKAARFASC